MPLEREIRHDWSLQSPECVSFEDPLSHFLTFVAHAPVRG